MENETSQKSWFTDLSWKTALVVAALSVVTGGGAGASVVATKAVAQSDPKNITQDQADVRYVSKEFLEKLRAQRDQQFAAIEKKMDDKLLTREVFEAYHKMDVERMDRVEKLILQSLEK